MLMAEVVGSRIRGGLRFVRMDGERKAVVLRGVRVKEAKEIINDRNMGDVCEQMSEFGVAHWSIETV